MPRDLLCYTGPTATTLWNIYNERASESTFDSDENAAVHSPEANLARILRPGFAFLDMPERVACALGESELDPEAPNVFETGLEELASFIDELSISSISVFTSTLFDLILAEAEVDAQECGDDDLRRRCILCLARVLGDDFLVLAFWALGTPGAPWKRLVTLPWRNAVMTRPLCPLPRRRSALVLRPIVWPLSRRRNAVISRRRNAVILRPIVWPLSRRRSVLIVWPLSRVPGQGPSQGEAHRVGQG